MTQQNRPKHLAPLDYLAIAGGLINLALIGVIAGYWLFH